MVSGSSTSSGDQRGNFVADEHNILQKHVLFFDRNKDGIVYPWESFEGFRAIGCGVPFSAVVSFLINSSLSQKTRPGKFPSLLFPIEVKNIHKAKHRSDAGVYDNDGRFNEEKFEEIFTKHAHTHPNSLTSNEVKALLKSVREPNNYTGWMFAWAEWRILAGICKDRNGLLQKDTLRGVFDGSLFEQMEKERASLANKKD